MGAHPWPDTIPAEPEQQPACRDCGHTGRGLVASMVPGEHYCGSRTACAKRQARIAAGTDYGSWGTSPKWGRKRQPVQVPTLDGEPA